LLPLVPYVIRALLQQKWFIKSPMGFREFYTNKGMLDHNDNIAPYTKPIIDSQESAIGAFKYLKGIDWQLVDEFEQLHQKIKARTLFLWGANDKTFPLSLGKQMLSQFSSEIELIGIENTSLLPHEEKPEEVIDAILKFMVVR
ncbi:MAG: alpha/beta hydrolase, partial [Bacteroidota bacterium]